MKTGMLQKDLDRLEDWAVENAMKINPIKSKTVRFTRARVKDPLSYSLTDTLIPGVSSCKYLGIILRSNLNWTACWDPYREGQKIALDRVQKKAAKFAYHTNSSNWETSVSPRNYHAYVHSSRRTLEKGRGRL